MAFAFTACTPEPTADVKWHHAYIGDPTLDEIRWVSGGQEDASWMTPLTSVGQETEIQTITELAGEGQCQDDGLPGIIEIDPGSAGVKGTSGFSITIEEDATANLYITGSTAAK